MIPSSTACPNMGQAKSPKSKLMAEMTKNIMELNLKYSFCFPFGQYFIKGVKKILRDLVP
jgi:hypothetical protein